MAGKRARIYLETGKSWTFASAVDWPGWSRRAKSPEAAIETLDAYADRYRRVAGSDFQPGSMQQVATVVGNATTDMGAPAIPSPTDDARLTAAEVTRQLDLLKRAWDYFDAVVRDAPARLAKGPRGGGRDRDEIVAHVQEAERAYGRKLDVRVPPRTPWPEQREQLLSRLADGESAAWPWRYGVRRIAWHVLDHAWEIEDKS